MAHNNIEIEIQVKIEDAKPLQDFLETKGVFKHEVRQLDEYFTSAADDFIAVRPVSRWLRLRKTEKACFLNYKNWHFDSDGHSHHCDEFETIIDNIEVTKNILLALNYKVIATVDKVRKIWTCQDYEIALDSVKDLGEFVEIEYIGHDKEINPKQVTDEMIKFLKDLGVGKIIRNHVGYPFLLLFPEEVKYEIL